MRPATKVASILMLLFQGGCYGPLGTPVPLQPDDPSQQRAIEESPEVVVTTAGEQTYKLTHAVVDPPYLRGVLRDAAPPAAKAKTIPLDSIVSIRIREPGTRVSRRVLITAGVVGGIVVWCLLEDCLNFPLRGRWGMVAGDPIGY